ncbi:conserved hypothetical integral membrane protein [Actinomyces howellii]|uniref:Conserved hypothetical integral membrane protein n=1 Tax=Actinomyces howellii TaxID=52771 RepID=A0A448HK22_9ACTO|nr:MptD family putative ECF transporter S component [Actinomyces howellii]VEG29968.1 conserved hypothetical integral membrane protein [Actinomyces howellii]
MTTRDLVNSGVFSAVYFVLLFSTGMLGVINPAMMFVGFALGIIANGVTLALYRARVRKVGAMAVLGVVVGLLMMLSGHPWYLFTISGLLGLVSDLIAAGRKFRDPRTNALAYAVLSLWYVGPWLPMILNREAYRAYIADSMGQAYADSLAWFFSPTMLAAWGVCVFVLGLVGGAFGNSVLQRHFAKAGLAG